MSDLLDMAAEFFSEREWPHRRTDKPLAIEVTHDWSGVTQPMTSALMTGVVNPNHQAMQQYFAGLLDVLQGEREPDEAFREAMEEP